MNQRNLHLIISTILVFFVVAACSFSPAAPSAGSTATTVAATNPPVSTAAATNPPVSVSGGGGCNNSYFPSTTGTSWSYASSGGTLGAFTYTWTVTDRSDTGFSINAQYSSGTNAIVKWECRGGRLAALDAGSNSLSFSNSKYSMTSNSVTAEGFNVPISFAAGNTWSEKVTVDGTVVYGTKTVDSQIASNVDCTAAGPDSTTVPAGTFNTVKATCNQTIGVAMLVQGTPVPAGVPSNVSITDWYAKGVGLVESVRTSTAGGTETIVLTAYKVQ